MIAIIVVLRLLMSLLLNLITFLAGPILLLPHIMRNILPIPCLPPHVISQPTCEFD
jgi:hypothetical protein